MYAGKKASLLQWEKVLIVMMNGQPVNEDILSKMKEMDGVPMYRLSSFIYHVKLAGGVVKVVKNGRKIESYQLINVKDMEKYLANREKTFAKAAPKVKATKAPKTPAPVKTKKTTKVTKLKDLQPVVAVQETTQSEVSDLVITELPEATF